MKQSTPLQILILITYFIDRHLCYVAQDKINLLESIPSKNKHETSFENFNNADEWSETKIHVKKLLFRWSIINFSFHGKSRGEYIQSPIFSDTSDSNYKWRLKLYPYGYDKEEIIPTWRTTITTTTTPTPTYDEDYQGDEPSPSEYKSNDDVHGGMAIQLSLVSGNNPAYIKSKIALLTANNEVIYTTGVHVGTVGGTDSLIFDDLKYLLQDDTLTVAIEITRKINETEYTGNCGSALNTANNAHVDNFEKLLEDEILSDVTFKIKSYELKAHKAILAAVSSVFLDEFTNMEDSNMSEIIIDKVEPKIFKEMLRFAYIGKVENLEKNAKKLLPLAHQYNITQLKNMCERALCQNLNSDNAIEYFQLATNNNASYLRMKAFKYIIIHSQKIIDSPSFISLISEDKNLINTIHALNKDFTG